jgi:hypothetical protein
MATQFPDATTTGVPCGMTLSPSGSLTINTPGAVIEGLDIRGSVTILADNVTLMNCKITSDDWAVINVVGNGDVVENCEINGMVGDGTRGISGQGTFLNNNIYNVEDGIYITGSNTDIEGNYIHDLQSSNSSPHYDGIQTDSDSGGYSNITISYNSVVNQNTQTSAVNISNYFGPISNVNIDNNLLVGGGYTIYVDGQFSGGPITQVSVTNNHIGPGYYGPTDFNQTSPDYTGNVYDGYDLAQTLNQSCPEGATDTGFSTDSGAVGDHITNDPPNLVANGSFETGDFTGWTLGGNFAPLSAGAQTFINGEAQSGVAAAGLGSVDTDGTLSQNIQTTAGQHYTLDFWLANASSGPNDFTVKWNGIELLALVNAPVQAYTEYTFDVVGTAGTSQLEFDFRQDPSYWSLDSISVTSVGMQTPVTDTIGGTTSPASAPLSVTVDTVAPAQPVIASFTTDSGTVGDHITNDSTLTLTGTGETNSTVTVYDGTKPLGTAAANGSGAWSYTTGILLDGTHNLSATNTDAAGNVSAASSVMAVTIDTHAPAQPVIASFSTETGTIGDGITSDHTLILTGTAEANRIVKVYDGTTLLGTAAANGTGAWSYATGTLSNNTHSFTATDTDAAGNVSAPSSALAVTVAANHLPAVTASDFTASHNHGHDWSAWQEFHVLG